MKFALFALAVPLALFAQNPVPPYSPAHTVRAAGEATVNAKPDQLRLSLGVTTQAATAGDAVAQNATQVAGVVDAMKRIVGSAGELRTTNYSVGPQYRYTPNQEPTIVGYQANQTVEVILNDISLAGKLIDGSSKAGANNVNRLEWTLKDDHAVREQAIAKATAVARANAETIAKALNLSVTGVAWAETGDSGQVRPLMAPMARAQMTMAKDSTQVESGTLEIHAAVTVALDVK